MGILSYTKEYNGNTMGIQWEYNGNTIIKFRQLSGNTMGILRN